mmetsp:Transcript_13525/g.21094  ORF Transcript_13525/g.21094 Transcript_13525/m.21094 type:complete len:84 (-) Transcript_13525:293-544(-)
MDAFKMESLRTTTQILDFMGDMGGFFQAIDLMIFLVAEYFAARFFLASIATSLYVLRDSKKNSFFSSFKQGLLSMLTFRKEPL